MLFLLDILIVALLALIITTIFIGAAGWRRTPEDSVIGASIFFFFILLFGLWASYLWIPPGGPMLAGVAIVPLLFLGLVIALTAAAANPPPRRPKTGVTEPAERTTAAFGLFFWLLITLLIMAVALGYAW